MGTLAGLSLSLKAQELGQAQELTIYARRNGPPKHYLDEQGKPRGYAVEIAVEAVRRAGLTPVVENLPWKRAQQEAQSGNGIITAFSKTPERSYYFLYSDMLYVDRIVLVQRRETLFQFSDYDDLLGKRIGIARGSVYAGGFAQAREDLSLVEDNGHQHRLLMLMAGRLEAGIFSGDIYAVRYNARAAGVDPESLVIAEKAIADDPNYLGIPFHLKAIDPYELRTRLNLALRGMREDGTIERIRTRYSQ